MAPQEYRPASDMMRGVNVSVENIPDTADISTRSVEVSSESSKYQSISTVTSVSTESLGVALQFKVCLVPSYSGPLGTPTDTDGEGTIEKVLEVWID